MRLHPELEARFLKLVPKGWVHPGDGTVYTNGGFLWVETMAEADGLWFLCPKCFAENAGPRGTHGVICWFVGKVADDVSPGPGRWMPEGTGLADLTFVPSPGRSQSVLLLGEGCQWHGFVKDGDAT